MVYSTDLQATLPDFHQPDINQPHLDPNKLLEFHLEQNPNFPVAILTDISTKELDNVLVTWLEAGEAILKTTREISETWLSDRQKGAKPLVVGILASGDPLAYFVAILALIRLGCIPFAISPRNSPAALAHLIQKTNCNHLFVAFDPTQSEKKTEKINREQVQNLVELLPEGQRLHMRKLPETSDLFPRLKTDSPYEVKDKVTSDLRRWIQSCPSQDQPGEKTMMILHSSGTTKFPKPIYMSYATFRSGLNVHKFTEFDWKNQVTSAMALPPFHSMAFNVGFFPVLYEGTISALFRPEFLCDGIYETPTINSVTVMSAMRRAGCSIGIFSPTTLLEYSEDPRCVEFLKTMERVAFGGGPLRADVGNFLTRSGVKLASLYGSTETGCMVKFFGPPSEPDNWEYFEFSPHITPHLVPHGENEYELIIKSSAVHRCSVDYEDADLSEQYFNTNDLLYKHPILPLYRVVGRIDDQIMLSNSEKTNPGPLEAILCLNREIGAALMFGRGKPQNGVLIEPSRGCEVDVQNAKAVEAYIDRIWPSVEEMNEFAPSHSRLTRNLILIIDPRVNELPKTLKGGVARTKALEIFSKEIEQVYTRAEDAVSVSYGFKLENLLDFKGDISMEKSFSIVKFIVEDIIDRPLDQTMDLFKQGCDSLHATQIRSKFMKICQDILKKAVVIPQSIVYQQPSIVELSNWFASLFSTNEEIQIISLSSSSTPKLELAAQALHDMLEMYKPRPTKVVLITGTTGSLGAYVLEDILKNREVDLVFALNRSSRSQNALERHLKTFEERKLDQSILNNPKLKFLTADRLSDLSEAQRHQLSESVTHVLHLSYPVNFNLNLSGFKDAIQFTKDLTELFRVPFSRSESVKPTFVFASSVATLANYSGPPEEWVDEAQVDLLSCLGTGYGESKRVCEQIIESSAKEYGFNSVILRIAQLCGSRKNGAWNKTEWFPLIVQSGVALGCLPDGLDDIAWIPVDQASTALNDIAFFDRHQENKSTRESVYRHLVHPKPICWQVVIREMARKITELRKASGDPARKEPVRLISYSEWVDNISRLSQDPTTNETVASIGAIKLVDHFCEQLDRGGLHDKHQLGFEAMGVKRMVTTRSELESQSLRNCPPLALEDVARWFDYWKTARLFDLPRKS